MSVARKRSYGGYLSSPNKWRGVLPSAGTIAKYAGRQIARKIAGNAMNNAWEVSKRYLFGKRRSAPVAQQAQATRQYMRGQSYYGVLAGKVNARRGARSFRRRGRRYTKKSAKRLHGVSYQTEFASYASGNKCVYIGHTTALPDELLRLLVMSCMKNVLVEFGVTINSWPQSRTGYLSNGDIFQFVYKPDPNATPSPTGCTLTVNAGHVTFWDIASNLFSIVKATMAGGSLGDGLILTEFQFIRSGSLTKVDLQDAMMSFYVKSSLKIQNRSVAAAGDDEMDVNNVPVYGKLYKGTGNGALQRTVDQIIFINGAATANNTNVDASLYPNFAEPPHPAEFTHVNRYGKVYINPGQIKTNVLHFKSKINVTNLFIKLYRYYWNNGTSDWFNLGIFGMFGLERVIAKLDSESSPGINITYEIDNKCFGQVYPAPQKYTTPMRVVS